MLLYYIYMIIYFHRLLRKCLLLIKYMKTQNYGTQLQRTFNCNNIE